MKAKVARWGNSLALRLPKSVTSELGFSENSLVEFPYRGWPTDGEVCSQNPHARGTCGRHHSRKSARRNGLGPGAGFRILVSKKYLPERGDLVWIDPQVGREQAGRRPAVVLSPRFYNEKSALAWICPITSKAKGYPFEVPLPKSLPADALLQRLSRSSRHASSGKSD